jgi:hypothetical protein
MQPRGARNTPVAPLASDAARRRLAARMQFAEDVETIAGGCIPDARAVDHYSLQREGPRNQDVHLELRCSAGEAEVDVLLHVGTAGIAFVGTPLVVVGGVARPVGSAPEDPWLTGHSLVDGALGIVAELARNRALVQERL